jgi:hypothetical protein
VRQYCRAFSRTCSRSLGDTRPLHVGHHLAFLAMGKNCAPQFRHLRITSSSAAPAMRTAMGVVPMLAEASGDGPDR